MLQVFIIIPPISIFLCKRLAAEKRRRERKAKERLDPCPNEKYIYMQPKFSFILQSLKREKLFSSMEHCRIRLSPLSFYLIYSPSF
jgi:hypothetical protein